MSCVALTLNLTASNAVMKASTENAPVKHEMPQNQAAAVLPDDRVTTSGAPRRLL